MSLIALVNGCMPIFAFIALLKLLFLPNIVVLRKLTVKEIRILIILLLDFPIKGKFSAR